MKHYVFLKRSSSIQLAHLYEHLICRSIREFLTAKGLHTYIDYDLVGKTYYGGLVYIQVTLYPSTKVNIERFVRKLRVATDETSLTTGIDQLIAEKESTFTIKSRPQLAEELIQLDKQKWQSLDSLTIIDAKPLRLIKGPISYDDHFKNPKRLSLVITNTKPVDRSLLPLAKQLTKAVGDNIIDELCDQYGFFSIDDTFTVQKDSFRFQNKLQANADSLSDHDYSNTVTSVVNAMAKNGALKRFSQQLSKQSFLNKPESTVNFETTYEDTLVFIGSKGWAKIATLKNIEKLLQDFNIVFKIGSERVVLSFPKIEL